MSSIYSAASADSPSDSSEPGCEPSPSAKSTPTPVPSSESTGPASPVTTTCEQLPLLDCEPTGSNAMSSAGDSLVRTSVSLAAGLALLASDQGYGVNLRASLASYDRASWSWRTSQHCLSGELEPYSETWPESGMTRNGRLYPRAQWVPHMCDDECSLWPTPTASMDGRGFGIPLHERSGRYKRSTVSRVRALVGEHGWRIHPNFTEALMGFPSEWTAIEESEMPSSRKSSK